MTAPSSNLPAPASGPSLLSARRETISPHIAAKRAGVSRWTIYRLLNEGFIEGYKPSPRKLFIYADSLEAHRLATQDPVFWELH